MFKFDELKTAAAAPPRSFLPSDAKSRFDDGSDAIRGYLPGHSWLIEILASRYFYVLNCCDHDFESVLTTVLRPIGWGCRMAFFVFGVIFCALASQHEGAPLFRYQFSRERNEEGTLVDSSHDQFEWYVYAVYAVWVTSIATEALSYLVGRGGGRPHDGQCSSFPFFLMNRVSLGGADEARCVLAVVLMAFFLGLASSAAVMLYSVMAHCFVTRNVYFIGLFGVLVAFQLLGALADAVSIGGIDGLAVMNKPASRLASARILFVIPTLVIFSGFYIWLCLPPYHLEYM